jgi:hypothetical protein
MLGILLIYIFAFWLQWLPASGSVGRGLTAGFNWPYISSIGYHAILPATGDRDRIDGLLGAGYARHDDHHRR